MYKDRLDVLINQALKYPIALSLFNVECLLQGKPLWAHYSYEETPNFGGHHSIVIVNRNPRPILQLGNFREIVGTSSIFSNTIRHIVSEIITLQSGVYRFDKNRFDRRFRLHTEFVDYIRQCQEYTMQVYREDGIL
jgi:hypothetical protein